MPSRLRRAADRLFAVSCLLGAPSVAQSFVDVTAASPLAAVLHAPAASGLACHDFDGDGDPDLVLTEMPGLPLRYFRNDGNLTFSDLSAASGLGAAGNSTCYAAADIDNDDDLDLFVGNLHAPCQLFVNDGAGHFTEQALARGLVHSSTNYSACFGDYDRDGHVDLYLGNHFGANGQPQANILYRNTGGGVFTDLTAVAGVGDTGLTYAAAFLDYDDDGWPDIATANDRSAQLSPNELFHNNGNGTFTSVAAQVRAHRGVDGMGIDYADAFADGGTDLCISDSQPGQMLLTWSAAAGAYSDETQRSGMATSRDGWAVAFLDYDNDGWQDLHVVHSLVANSLFRNPAQPAAAGAPWPDVAATLGLDQPYAQFTTVVADFDGDGGLDLCHRFQLGSAFYMAPRGLGLLHNQAPRGNWLRFVPRGRTSNRDGIGARFDVVTGGHTQRQWVRSGTGFLGSSDLSPHFGLGAAAQADRVTVRWPSGQVQYLTDVPANQVVTVTEPTLTLRAPVRVGAVSALDLSVPSDTGLLYVMCLALQDTPRFPLGDGRELPIALDALAQATLAPGNGVLPGGWGLLDPQGRGSSPLVMPNLPALAGLTLHATAATVDTAHFGLVRTLFPRPLTFAVQ